MGFTVSVRTRAVPLYGGKQRFHMRQIGMVTDQGEKEMWQMEERRGWAEATS